MLRNEHAELTSVLRAIQRLLDRGPQDQPERFFDLLRAMLFYIDEFPEKQHHPKESDFLFPQLLRVAPQLFPAVEKLEKEHLRGDSLVRSLQHSLVAWEMMGESRSAAFSEAAKEYIAYYLAHMQHEESVIFPAAASLLRAEDWRHIDAAFGLGYAPFAGKTQTHSGYERLYFKIMAGVAEPHRPVQAAQSLA
jgi:hemerythrin-like domain-containing protein